MPGHTFHIFSNSSLSEGMSTPLQSSSSGGGPTQNSKIKLVEQWNLANEEPIARGGCLQRMKSTMQLHRIVEAFLTQVCNSVSDFLWCYFVLRPTLQEMAEASPQNTGLLGESYCYAVAAIQPATASWAQHEVLMIQANRRKVMRNLTHPALDLH